MTSREQVDLLMADVGPLLDPLLIEAHSEDPVWEILVDDDSALMIELDAARDMLVVSAGLGALVRTDKAAVYELFLRYADHWEATGGLRLALESEGDDLLLIRDVAAPGLDASRLAAGLAEFAARAHAWRDIVSTNDAQHVSDVLSDGLLSPGLHRA